MTPELRRMVLRNTPNSIADGYELPRNNVQAILTRLVEVVNDLQRK